MNYKMSLFVISQIRKFSVSKQFNQRQKNHYESLGIKKNATQADIKNAYYNLSKVYHPDKNQGYTTEQRKSHSQKFRDITEAYEILGNVRTRKMYDKGFLSGISHEPSYHTPEDPLHKFYKSRDTRTRPPPPGGRQPIYDFDEWSRKHYGESFKRDREVKNRREFYASYQSDKKEAQQQEKCFYVGLMLFFLCMIIKEVNDSDTVRSYLRKPNTDTVNTK